MPLPALHRRNQRAVDKTRMAPPICHCEEAAGRRGALSAKREEVPLGCNLGKAVTVSPIAFPRCCRVLRDCHVASLLAMTRQGGTAMGTVRRTELAVLLPLRGRAGHAPPLQDQCGFNGGRCESAVPARDCHVASLLAMTRQGGTAMGTVRRTELAVLLPLRGRAGHAPPLQDQCGFNGGRCESAVPSRDCHGPFGASQ